MRRKMKAGGWDSRYGRGIRPKRVKPHVVFFMFASVFGMMFLLVAGGMAVFAFTLSRIETGAGSGSQAALIWLLGCGLSLALPGLAAWLGITAFRSIARPLASVMAAADAVAEGDLTARIEERGRGPFKRLARSFNRMTEALARSTELRRAMLADTAHELRTPLQVIQGNLEGVIDGVYEPNTEHIQATLNETRRLARLIEDLRTLTLAEAGELPLQQAHIDLRDVLEDAVTSFSGLAESAGVILRAEVPDQPLNLSADPTRIGQVLDNLVSNALRYTPAGGSITLAAHRREDACIVTVQDTGSGIPADQLDHVFDRFWRADPARTREDGSGGGLGLAIARQLIEAHGGTIAVESTRNIGTTFTLTLPCSEG